MIAVERRVERLRLRVVSLERQLDETMKLLEASERREVRLFELMDQLVTCVSGLVKRVKLLEAVEEVRDQVGDE
jgi:hypothetical protein